MSHQKCPWHHRYSAAAFAPQAIVRLLDYQTGFASPLVRRLYRLRAGFTIQYPDRLSEKFRPSETFQLAGALLSKIVHRGTPTIGSHQVERDVLMAAQEAGLLTFRDSGRAGVIDFDVAPARPDLIPMLKASLIPQLLVDDLTCRRLLEQYRTLCTSLELQVFDGLIQRFDDPRLGLLVLPQREMRTMLYTVPGEGVDESGRVDFAIQVPDLQGDDWLTAVLEVDDATHDTESQQAQDRLRDAALTANGWRSVRLPIAKRTQWDDLLDRVSQRMAASISPEILSAASQLRTMASRTRKAIVDLVAIPAAEAQLGSVVADMIYRGFREDIRVWPGDGLQIKSATEAINGLIRAVANIHSLRGLPKLSVVHDSSDADVTYYSNPTPAVWGADTSLAIIVSPQVVSPDFAPELLPASPAAMLPESEDDARAARAGLDHILQNVFRKVSFREGQVEIIMRALSLRPTVGLLPTAAGKSICYQVASMVQPGFTLIIDPLRSLMIDQMESLHAIGIERSVAVMSGMVDDYRTSIDVRSEIYRSVAQGKQWFVFVAPERLQMPEFRQNVRAFAAAVPVPFCVIDEAHCVSEWGHDFRTSYLNVGRLVRDYCRHGDHQPSLVALTGTASRNVIVDIMRELEIHDQEAVIEPKTFNRSELTFEVRRVDGRDRLDELAGRLKRILNSYGWRPNQPGPVPCGLIFTSFVNGDLGAWQLASELRQRLGVPVEVFAGGMPKAFPGDRNTWERHKLDVQRRFSRGEAPILVCTQAFGMGIDKPDVRFTVHLMLPRSLEAFYQECGRAGRDGSSSHCQIIFCDEQPGLTDEILDTTMTSLEQIEAKTKSVSPANQGDALRNTWFLSNSFIGRAVEKQILKYVVENLLSPHVPRHKGDRSTVEIHFLSLDRSLLDGGNARKRVTDDDRQTALEKALYRLMAVGALSDYMKDFTGSRFHVVLERREPALIANSLAARLRLYVTEGEARSYLAGRECETFEDAAYEAGAVWIDFIYETVEKRRRRAIAEMLETARRAADLGPEQFRRDLLAYLEESEFTAPVNNLIMRVEPEEWVKVLGDVKGADGIVKLAGACRRALTEFPSHPGLLILRGLCRFGSPETLGESHELRNGFIELMKHEQSAETRSDLAERLLDEAHRLFPSRIDEVICGILVGDPSREMTRALYSHVESGGLGHHLATRAILSHTVSLMTAGV